MTFSLILSVRTEQKEKRHSKVGYYFYLKVPKLANLANQNRENLKSLLIHLTKKVAAGSRKEN